MSAGETIGILVTGWVAGGVAMGASHHQLRTAEGLKVVGACVLFWPIMLPFAVAAGVIWVGWKLGKALGGARV